MEIKQGPDYRWGDIIQVPASAFCSNGLKPDYKSIYGIVVSSNRLWHARHEFELARDRNERREARQGGRPAPKRKVIGGQYLVVLIDETRRGSNLEMKLGSGGPFKGWYVAAGLLVSVLDSQMADIPASDRRRGRLKWSDQRDLAGHLKLLTHNDLWRRLPVTRQIGNWVSRLRRAPDTEEEDED